MDSLPTDVDGLSSMDFGRWRAKVAWAETIACSAASQGKKMPDIGGLLHDLGYGRDVGSRINNVFVDSGIL